MHSHAERGNDQVTGERVCRNQAGRQAAVLLILMHRPSRPEPVRQPVTTSIGASTSVDPRRVNACK